MNEWLRAIRFHAHFANRQLVNLLFWAPLSLLAGSLLVLQTAEEQGILGKLLDRALILARYLS